MHSIIEGVVWGFHASKKTVSVKTGLSPKVIRVPTEESWALNEKVYVAVLKADEVPTEAYIIGGLSGTDPL